MQVKKFGSEFRKWSRTIHRELSFFFAGVVLIYAISGFLLNHKRDFNAEYDITRKEFTLQDLPKSQADWNKDFVLSILGPLDEADNYTKHYFPADSQMKVFLKGGSSLMVNTNTAPTDLEQSESTALQSRTLVDRFFGYFRFLVSHYHVDRPFHGKRSQRLLGPRRC